MNRNLYTLADMQMQEIIESLPQNDILINLKKVIDWGRIEILLEKTDYRKGNIAGRDCYAPLIMFKVMMLSELYQLSDRDLEKHLKSDMRYIWFCDLSIMSRKPDHSTICKWRERFRKFKIFDEAFAEINSQLLNLGLELKEGLIIDGTLVHSRARQRNETIIDIHSEDNSSSHTNIQITKKVSVDPDAKGVMRRKRFTLGFNVLTAVNYLGFVIDLLTYPANVPDVVGFPDLIEKINPDEGTLVATDKGFASQYNSNILHERNLIDNIMQKHKPNERDDEKILRNKEISKIRYVVERTFGYWKLKLGGSRSRYYGLNKTHNSFVLKATLYNLIRCVKLL